VAQQDELVIRGGTLVDGTGAPGRPADVRVAGGRVAEIGPKLRAARELDARGCAVAPGFIDVHTHYDAQVFWDPMFSSSCWHGVTTVVAGNCGFTIAPTREPQRRAIVETLQAVEDMSIATLDAGIVWEFTTFREYLELVERRGLGLNFACYVGHSAVRLFAMGEAGYERAASEAEIAAMREVVADAVDAGAIGLASSFSFTHFGVGGKPVPSRHSGHEELSALASVLGEKGRGVVVFAPGAPVAYRDAYELQLATGRSWMWTPMITNYPEPDYHDAMRTHAAGRARGADVWAQVSCRPVSIQIQLANPYLFRTCPSFHALHDLPDAEKRRRYADPAWRRTAWPEIAANVKPKPSWEHVFLAESAVHAPLVGKSLAAIAAERGQTPLDAYCELSLAEDLKTRFTAQLSNYDEDAVAELLLQPGVVMGQSDAGAHVAQLCDANMPTDLLGGWVRERKRLPLERAVQMLSGDLARLLGLADRGTLEVGKAADVVVFDPETVAPGPLRRVRDLPGNEERLVSDAPEGVAHVLVNGTQIRTDGAPAARDAAARPGRVLRPSR
jgi:N-acyl-D-aspartate/D-glutamate deacylase